MSRQYLPFAHGGKRVRAHDSPKGLARQNFRLFRRRAYRRNRQSAPQGHRAEIAGGRGSARSAQGGIVNRTRRRTLRLHFGNGRIQRARYPPNPSRRLRAQSAPSARFFFPPPFDRRSLVYG